MLLPTLPVVTRERVLLFVIVVFTYVGAENIVDIANGGDSPTSAITAAIVVAGSGCAIVASAIELSQRRRARPGHPRSEARERERAG